MALPGPNGLGKTLRTNSGPCNVVLRPFRRFLWDGGVQPATMIGFKQIEFFYHTGMLSNMKSQLKQQSSGDRLDDQRRAMAGALPIQPLARSRLWKAYRDWFPAFCTVCG